MNGIELGVVIGGVGLIGSIAYYFFGPKGEVLESTVEGKTQRATIVVDAAYIPSELRLKAGVKTEITFDRRDKGDCTEWVIFEKVPNEGNKEIKARLPEGERTVVKFTPTKEGIYRFVCGMGMVHGQLVVNR